MALEIDSRSWHLNPGDWQDTMTRRNRMTGVGLIVLAFSPNQLRVAPAKFVASVRAALATGAGRVPPVMRVGVGG